MRRCILFYCYCMNQYKLYNNVYCKFYCNKYATLVSNEMLPSQLVSVPLPFNANEPLHDPPISAVRGSVGNGKVVREKWLSINQQVLTGMVNQHDSRQQPQSEPEGKEAPEGNQEPRMNLKVAIKTFYFKLFPYVN